MMHGPLLLVLAGLLSSILGTNISQVSLWSQVDSCAQSCASSASSFFAQSWGCSGDDLYICLCTSVTLVGGAAHVCASKSCTAFASYEADPERARAIVSELCWSNMADAPATVSATVSSTSTPQSTSSVSIPTSTQPFPSPTISSAVSTSHSDSHLLAASTSEQSSGPTSASNSSTSSSPTSQKTDASPTHLSTANKLHLPVGAIVGIAVGGSVLLGLAAFVCKCWRMRKDRSRVPSDQEHTAFVPFHGTARNPELRIQNSLSSEPMRSPERSIEDISFTKLRTRDLAETIGDPETSSVDNPFTSIHTGASAVSTRSADTSTEDIPSPEIDTGNTLLYTEFLPAPAMSSSERARNSVSPTIRDNGNEVAANDPREIQLYVANVPTVSTWAKLDTGTEDNLISFEHFGRLGRAMDKCEKPMTFTVGNGETVDVMGQTEIKFRSPKRKERRWATTFYIVKGLPYEVILGNEFLSRNKVYVVDGSLLPLVSSRNKESAENAKKRREKAIADAKSQFDNRDSTDPSAQNNSNGGAGSPDRQGSTSTQQSGQSRST